MLDQNKIQKSNLSELKSQEIKNINGGQSGVTSDTGVIPHEDEEQCPVHDPDNPFDDYFIIH